MATVALLSRRRLTLIALALLPLRRPSALQPEPPPIDHAMLFFDPRSDVVSTISQRQIEDMFRSWQIIRYRLPDVHFLVQGHSDGAEERAGRFGLGQRRARRAAGALLLLGVEPERIVTEALGSSRPLAQSTTASGAAINRRVEIRAGPESLAP
jgi:OOP family OmpA-OmpF porin